MSMRPQEAGKDTVVEKGRMLGSYSSQGGSGQRRGSVRQHALEPENTEDVITI